MSEIIGSVVIFQIKCQKAVGDFHRKLQNHHQKNGPCAKFSEKKKEKFY